MFYSVVANRRQPNLYKIGGGIHWTIYLLYTAYTYTHVFILYIHTSYAFTSICVSNFGENWHCKIIYNSILGLEDNGTGDFCFREKAKNRYTYNFWAICRSSDWPAPDCIYYWLKRIKYTFLGLLKLGFTYFWLSIAPVNGSQLSPFLSGEKLKNGHRAVVTTTGAIVNRTYGVHKHLYI